MIGIYEVEIVFKRLLRELPLFGWLTRVPYLQHARQIIQIFCHLRSPYKPTVGLFTFCQASVKGRYGRPTTTL
jgi:hypothetical protein